MLLEVDIYKKLSEFDLDVHFKINEICLGVMGPSGSGKSMTLKCIAGIETPDSGRIVLDGRVLYDSDQHINLTPQERNIGYMFQNYALFPHMNVYDNIAFGLKIKKMSKDVIEQKVLKMLKLINLEGFEKKDVTLLSGGQQQRIAIARALVNEPKVLLLDEPLGALDLKLRKEMQYELKKIQQEVGITFIYVTHDQEEALTMSDKIVVMKDGEIQQVGTPTDIYNEPENRYVANFIGESNIIPGVMLEDYKVRFHDIDFECVDAGFGCNTPVDVVVRPEDIDIMPLGKTALKGIIKSVLFMGVHYEFRIETGSFTWTVHSTDYVAPDTEISLEIVPDAIHIMHKSLKHDEQELLTEDEIADAAAAAEEE